VMLLAGVPTCLLVPVFAARGRDQRPAVAAMLALAGMGFAGLLIAPEAAPALWATLLGFSQGGLLALAFLFFSLRTPDQAHAAELSAMAQSVGYHVAAAGPLVVGVLRDTTGGWTAPLLFLIVVLFPLLAAGLAAGRSQIV
jgi:CP family cyanate transporter-like MFS transporter